MYRCDIASEAKEKFNVVVVIIIDYISATGNNSCLFSSTCHLVTKIVTVCIVRIITADCSCTRESIESIKTWLKESMIKYYPFIRTVIQSLVTSTLFLHYQECESLFSRLFETVGVTVSRRYSLMCAWREFEESLRRAGKMSITRN